MKNLIFTLTFLLFVYNLLSQTNTNKLNTNDSVCVTSTKISSNSKPRISTFNLYTYENTWSEWIKVGSCTGSVKYNIRGWQTNGQKGNTVYYQVRVRKQNGKFVLYSFNTEWFTFRTGRYYADIEVRVKANTDDCNIKVQIQ